MPVLGVLLTNLFGGLVAWLTQWVSRKVAFGLSAVAVMSGLTLGIYGVMRGLLAALNAYVTGAPLVFIQAVAMVIPPAAPVCLSAYITMWTACMVYTWQRDLLYLFAKAG